MLSATGQKGGKARETESEVGWNQVCMLARCWRAEGRVSQPLWELAGAVS